MIRIRASIARRVNRLAGKFGLVLFEDPADKPQDAFHIDEPTNSVIYTSEFIISGWYLPVEPQSVRRVRAKLNGKIIPLKFNTKRPDVAANFPGREDAIHSGFYKRIPYQGNGAFVVEVDKGNGFEPFYTTQIEQDTEMLVDMLYNPDLLNRYPQHLNLLQSQKQYFYEHESVQNFKRHENDPRLVALYLGQFHPIPENDHAWGKGFTEWRNVTTAMPRFVGHQQPFLPEDLGFYDLRFDTVIGEQVALAKKYGIYGFCFYYYWFSGKKLLERPLETFLRHKEWDFHFSICWANENWTKRWDGRDDEIIVAQKYRDEDPIDFIKEVEHILMDPRYIREDNKPVLTVYRCMKLNDPSRYAKVWREYMRKKYGLELYLISVLSTDMGDPREYGFDIALDFVPSTLHVRERTLGPPDRYNVDVKEKLLDVNFKGIVADYRKVVLDKKLYPYFDFPTIKCVMPSWDNEARKKGGGFAEIHTSPDLYERWLGRVLDLETKNRPDPLIFINAWNEWAEGVVLEPTLHQGHAILRRTAEVLSRYSGDASNLDLWPSYGLPKRKKLTKLAVIVHIYNEAGWHHIERKLAKLGLPYDLFITMLAKNQHLTGSIKSSFPGAQIMIVPNRGRDILPFIFVARRLSELGYGYVLKLHTGLASNAPGNDDMAMRTVDQLLPNSKMLEKELVRALTEGAAFIEPKRSYVSLGQNLGNSEGQIEFLLSQIYGIEEAKRIISEKDTYNFFAGGMFWCRLEAIQQLLDLYLNPEDFEAESGQIDSTMARGVERLLSLVPVLNSGEIYQISAAGIVPQKKTTRH